MLSRSALLTTFAAAAAAKPLAIHFGDDGSSYEVLVGGRPWLESGSLRFFVNGEWHEMASSSSHATLLPVVTGTISPVGKPTSTTGTDRFGAFERVTFDWIAKSSTGEVASFATGVRSYKSGATLVFEQSIAEGATRTNHKNVTFADGINGQRATTEPWPFLHVRGWDTNRVYRSSATAIFRPIHARSERRIGA